MISRVIHKSPVQNSERSSLSQKNLLLGSGIRGPMAFHKPCIRISTCLLGIVVPLVRPDVYV